MDTPQKFQTDILVVGGGGAGMYAALSAAEAGASVILLDKNVVGRGGATIMAQMTCAAALGEQEPDDPERHLADTLEAGRGLCNEALSRLVCEETPTRIRELAGWKVDFARQDNGRIKQVKAPGHSARRCVYVDFLRTGAAISAALRNKTSRTDTIRKLSNVTITDLILRDGEIAGAAGFDITTTQPVIIEARAVILATGGMTKMYARTTAPNNSAGEGLGLALRAGARVIDLEFLQFYPNGHLAPRMVGLDPTTWEPTRVKLGGRLLNSDGEEFLENYGEASGDGYSTTRDTLTHAMFREVAAGRGSPHGGVYLSFEHIPEAKLKDALGPFMDIFAANNIDLTKRPVEVFPIAHYQMGGVEVDTGMATCVPGLYAAGELAGGANGANRLSGNALPEAMVFGHRAGVTAARYVTAKAPIALEPRDIAPHTDLIRAQLGANPKATSTAEAGERLRKMMWQNAGAFRNEGDLKTAYEVIRGMRSQELDTLSVGAETIHNASLTEWFELRNGLLAAEALVLAARQRRESRGAHQRDDFPDASNAFLKSQHLAFRDDIVVSDFPGVPEGAPS